LSVWFECNKRDYGQCVGIFSWSEIQGFFFFFSSLKTSISSVSEQLVWLDLVDEGPSFFCGGDAVSMLCFEISSLAGTASRCVEVAGRACRVDVKSGFALSDLFNLTSLSFVRVTFGGVAFRSKPDGVVDVPLFLDNNEFLTHDWALCGTFLLNNGTSRSWPTRVSFEESCLLLPAALQQHLAPALDETNPGFASYNMRRDRGKVFTNLFCSGVSSSSAIVLGRAALQSAAVWFTRSWGALRPYALSASSTHYSWKCPWKCDQDQLHTFDTAARQCVDLCGVYWFRRYSPITSRCEIDFEFALTIGAVVFVLVFGEFALLWFEAFTWKGVGQVPPPNQ
jgi:hypothetical protein